MNKELIGPDFDTYIENNGLEVVSSFGQESLGVLGGLGTYTLTGVEFTDLSVSPPTIVHETGSNNIKSVDSVSGNDQDDLELTDLLCILGNQSKKQLILIVTNNQNSRLFFENPSSVPKKDILQALMLKDGECKHIELQSFNGTYELQVGQFEDALLFVLSKTYSPDSPLQIRR